MARKKEKKVEEGGPGFLTTYADIVTLLMAFFVMLFAISSVEEEKFIALLKGLEDALGNSSYQEQIQSGGASLIGANLDAGSAIPAAGGAIVLIPNVDVAELEELKETVEGARGQEILVGLARTDDLDEDGEPIDDTPKVGRLLDLSELAVVQDQLLEAAATAGLQDAVSAELRPRGLVVVLSADDILFRSGSDVLEPGIGQDFIGTIASVVSGIDNPLQIEGHTDDIPLGAGGYSNWNLSADRAIAVLDVLVNDYAIDPGRMEVVAFGDQRPRVENTSDENRARNRRVEVVIGVDESDESLVTTNDQRPGTGHQ